MDIIQNPKINGEFLDGNDKGKTTLPDVSGIPLTEVLPKVYLGRRYRKESIEGLYENLPEYMQEYLSSRKFPLYLYKDGVETPEVALKVYAKANKDYNPENYMYESKETPETVVGYAVWSVDDSGDFYINSDYFYDISDNSFKTVYDENEKHQYYCLGGIDSFLGYKHASIDKSYTASEIDKIRKYYYESNKEFWDRMGFSNYEFQYIFPEASPEVEITSKDIAEVASEPSSMETINTIANEIEYRMGLSRDEQR